MIILLRFDGMKPEKERPRGCHGVRQFQMDFYLENRWATKKGSAMRARPCCLDLFQYEDSLFMSGGCCFRKSLASLWIAWAWARVSCEVMKATRTLLASLPSARASTDQK